MHRPRIDGPTWHRLLADKSQAEQINRDFPVNSLILLYPWCPDLGRPVAISGRVVAKTNCGMVIGQSNYNGSIFLLPSSHVFVRGESPNRLPTNVELTSLFQRLADSSNTEAVKTAWQHN